MWPRPDRASGVVKEEREIEDKRVVEFLEETAVSAELRVFGVHDLVEFIDADQRVFVGRVTMEKLMLHQAGELAEFRNVTAEKINPVHHPQDAPDLAFPRDDAVKNFPRLLAAAKRARDESEISREQVRQVRTQLEPPALGHFEDFHHGLRFFLEYVGALGEELPLPNAEMPETFLRGFESRQETEK